MRSVPLILLVFALVGGAAALIFAPIYLDLFRRELSRADEIEEIGRELGLRFSRRDPAHPGSTAVRYPFELFSRGIAQTCENFIVGTIGISGHVLIVRSAKPRVSAKCQRGARDGAHRSSRTGRRLVRGGLLQPRSGTR